MATTATRRTTRRANTTNARRRGPAANLPTPKPKAEPGTTKSTRNAGRMWSEHDLRELRALAKQNTPTRVIGLKLGRTETSVRSQAARQGLSLKPTNQSPRTPKR
jgi:hypothetical protein